MRGHCKLTLVSLLVLVAACNPEQVETLCDPDVSGISMSAIVENNVADGISATARLEYTDTPCDGDSLAINGVEAWSVDTSSGKRFEVHFDVEAADHEYVFEFHRPGRDEPVIATATMPEYFDVTAPTPGSEVSLEDGFEVVWGPPRPGTIEIEFQDYTPNDIECLNFHRAMVDDTGAYQLPGGTIAIDEEEVWEPGLCELLVALERVNDGVYPPEFAPGEITAHRYSSVAVTPIYPTLP